LCQTLLHRRVGLQSELHRVIP